MIQAFYTASSGMHVQQKNIDVISDNITNIATPGYRVKRAEFREILSAQANNVQDSQIGYGVKIANISTMSLPDDVNPFGLKIDEKGYFTVEDSAGNRSYTKDGEFKLLNENNRNYLATKNNEYVLDSNGNKIELDSDPNKLVISGDALYSNGNNGEPAISLALVEFTNPFALQRTASESFNETPQSGAPNPLSSPKLNFNYIDKLEPLASANQINEITKMVQTQMAYSVGSKALQTADEMEGIANHLRY